MKYLLLLFIPVIGMADGVKPFVFIIPKAACTLMEGKLLLSKAWPLGSWEDCANAVLLAAQQLDNQKDALEKQLSAERDKAVSCPTLSPKK